MQVTRTGDPAALLAVAGPFLVEREAEHNLHLGILSTLRDHPGIYVEPPYLASVGDDAGIALVAVRTPPFGVVLSEAGAAGERLAAAIDALVTDLAGADPAMRAATGPPGTLAPFVARWTATTGTTATPAMAERIYRLSRVIPPRAVPGAWRLAGERDRALLLEWLDAFQEEAFPPGSPRAQADEMVDRWVGPDDRFAYLWEVGGRVTALAGANARTPNGRRIGPVYTPPADRGHGYASAVTAAASADQLARGVRFCFLFTDLANPTSNAIYQRIGYEPVGDVDQVRFDPAAV